MPLQIVDPLRWKSWMLLPPSQARKIWTATRTNISMP